jgi:hypothetical protein
MSDPLFHIIEDAQVILYSRGVYKQAKLYLRAGQVYAAWGGGYIRMLGGRNTTKPDVTCVSHVRPPPDLLPDGVFRVLDKVAFPA